MFKSVGNMITVQVIENAKTKSGIIYKDTTSNKQRLGYAKVINIGDNVDETFKKSIREGMIIGFDVHAGQEFEETIDNQIVQFRIIKPDNIFGVVMSDEDFEDFKKSFKYEYVKV